MRELSDIIRYDKLNNEREEKRKRREYMLCQIKIDSFINEKILNEYTIMFIPNTSID